jgi:hypothetical protein
VSLAARQALLSRFLDDPAVERRVREDPEGIAREAGVPAEFARWLSALDPRRVAAFRRSRAHKEAVRAGRPPTRVDG